MSYNIPNLTDKHLQGLKLQKAVLDNMPTTTLVKLAKSQNTGYLSEIGTIANKYNSERLNSMTKFANSINVDFLSRVSVVSKMYSGLPKFSNLDMLSKASTGHFGAIAKIINQNNKVFSNNLFSDDMKDRIKEFNEWNPRIIDNSFSLLRYQYVKNTLFKAKPYVIIYWNPSLSKHNKYIANVNSNNINNNPDTNHDVHKPSPLLISFIGGAFTGNLSNALEPVIHVLSNELLPFIPEEYRPICLFIIVLTTVFDNPYLENQNDDEE